MEETQPEITQATFDRDFLMWLVEGPGPEGIELTSRHEPTPCLCEYCSFKRYLEGQDATDPA